MTEHPARIIHLGEVRPRRVVGEQVPERHYLAALGLLGAGFWILWLIVLMTVPPVRLLTYLAFFIPLWGALSATSSSVAYLLMRGRHSSFSLPTCVRSGTLASSLLVINLAVVAAQRWSIVWAALSVLAFLIFDVVVERKQTGATS